MHKPLPVPGFTLIELIISLAIFTLLAGLASASWTAAISSSQHRTLLNDIRGLFAVARSHAVNQYSLTTICPLSDTQTCVDDWSLPIAIFPDMDNDKKPDGARIHRVFNLSRGQSQVYSRTAGRGYFQLKPNGMSGGTFGSLVACTNASGAAPKISYVAINIGGRLRVLNDKDRDGTIKLPWGPVITCRATP